MPDRILRAELLTSEAWLALKNNDDRVCWLTLFLNADTFGNQPAGPHRLVHLWRYAGIDTTEKASKVLSELADVDLVRSYAQGDKQYVHIPRFKQSRRFLGKLWPLPDWATHQEKQAFANKSQVNPKSAPDDHGEPPEGVRGRGRYNSKALGDKSPQLPKLQWWETDSGMLAKGKALGTEPRPGEGWPQFKDRLFMMLKANA